MEKNYFLDKKKKLTDLIEDYLANSILEKNKRDSIISLLDILNQYSFENRLQKKGFLSHVVIDSADIEYSLGEKLIIFDNSIR